jgi:hypothetical protein
MEFTTKNGVKVLIDEEDYPYLNKFLWKAIKKRNKYTDICSTHYGRIVRMHRLVMNVTDSSILIDHINCNPLDNRKQNLRICTAKQNSRNRKKWSGKYSSIYKGVCWNKIHKKWTSRIKTDSKRILLGYFDDEILAAKAYDRAAKKYHKNFANLNFKEDTNDKK